jgi:hypothetical protein
VGAKFVKEDLSGRGAFARRVAMKSALTTAFLIIFSLSCGVQAKAQDSKTEPAPNITGHAVSMVYAPPWSGLARSGVSISVNPGVYVLDSRLGKVSFCETEVDQPGAARNITLRCSDWSSLPPH